ncbi:MAG: hypothetical protein ABIZ80_25055, partial [Bryobacteraceae bacterium]
MRVLTSIPGSGIARDGYAGQANCLPHLAAVPLLCGLTVALLAGGCGERPNTKGVLPDQSAFLVKFGVTDEAPADWSGSVEAAGGRVVTLAPWHFDKDDRLGAQPASWKCATRLSAVPDPKDWFVGALHIVPKDMTVPKGKLIQNGLYMTLESAGEARVGTAQGRFSFRPADVRFGAPVRLLNGRVEVERIPAALNLTAADGLEDDYPTVAFDNGANAWAAWTGYKNEKETLLVARTDGTEKHTVAEGEFFRPRMAAGKDGKLYLAVSVHIDNTWKVAVA